MGGTEGVHDEHVAQGGVFLCQFLIVLLLAGVETHVLEQHDLAVGNVESTVEVVLDQAHFRPSFGSCRPRSAHRVLFVDLALFRAAAVRHDHDLAPALAQCSTVGIDAVMRASEVTLPS